MCKKLVYLISFVLVLSIAGNASAELVAHWKFDEGSGTVAFDSTGRGNDGTLVGDPQWVSGKLGGALEFDGDGDYVDCGNTPDLTPTEQITVMCWFKVAAFTKNWQAILAKGDDSYRLSSSGGGNVTHMGIAPQEYSFDAVTVVTDDQWHHIAGWFDGGEARIYIDGELDATKVFDRSTIGASSFPLFIGENSEATGRFLIGLVDDVRIYNNALTEPEILGAMEGTGANPYALAPVPEDGALHEGTWVSLGWRAGDFAVSHDVYFGENFDDVNAGAEGTFQGNQVATFMVVGFPGFPLPEGLVPGTTYYWRIDEVNDTEPNSPWKGDVWSFTVPPKTAYEPNPPNGAKFVDSDTDLSWTAGFGAKLHTVYFGDNFDDVNNAAGGLPQGTTTYALDTLELEKTYYWRVDEFDAITTYRGDVWSFMTARAGGGVRADYYKGMNFRVHVLTRIDPQINFNWGDPGSPDPGVGNDNFSVRWTGEVEAVFTETYTFYTNSDDGVRLWVDGQQLVDNWTNHGPTEDRGKIDFVAGQTYSVVMEYYENTGGAVAELRWSSPGTPKQLIPQAALSPPVKTGSPNPSNGATDVKQVQILSWSPGDYTASHRVYFGTDQEAVRNANTGSPEYKGAKDLGSESYDPGKLEWDTTYYWRVDEVNNVNPDSPWIGKVWSFTTANFLIVDDFEDYDIGDNQIWYAWHDGFGYGTPGTEPYYPGNGTGSAVGDETTGSYMEETIVHGGSQSMPLSYDNSVLKYSEVELTLSYPRDWTEKGVNTLTIWFRGNPAGWVEAPDGTYTMSASGADIWGQSDEFRYAFKQLSGAGSISAQVLSVENTDGWAKAGLMIRESLAPGSKFAFVFVSPANGCRFQARVTTDADAIADDSVTTLQAIKAPHWIKLERNAAGDFNAYNSDDGVTWSPLAWNPRRVLMSPNVYIGLALTSHSAGVTGKAEFSNVQTTGTVTPMMWTHEAIGATMASNDAEPMYVALNGNAVVYHDNPNAALIDTWTEWNIDLQAFGVNLTNVNTIAIGFGDKKNPQPGGSGTAYFDDIRLYRLAP